MGDNKWWQDNKGDIKASILDFLWYVMVVFVVILIIAAIPGIVIGVTYAVQGCFVNKGHIGPHISDGCYEYQITDMKFPRSETATFYMRGVITGKGEREYTISAGNSLGEQAWSQNIGGYITVWSKNNHIIKYHIGRKKPNEPR